MNVINLDMYTKRGGDHGCHWWSKCATCPYAVCRLDMPPMQAVREKRDAEMLALRYTEKVEVNHIHGAP